MRGGGRTVRKMFHTYLTVLLITMTALKGSCFAANQTKSFLLGPRPRRESEGMRGQSEAEGVLGDVLDFFRKTRVKKSNRVPAIDAFLLIIVPMMVNFLVVIHYYYQNVSPIVKHPCFRPSFISTLDRNGTFACLQFVCDQ